VLPIAEDGGFGLIELGSIELWFDQASARSSFGSNKLWFDRASVGSDWDLA
jgi:hypothetical protein